MREPAYCSKFTLKDYLVRKDSELPRPPSSTKDYMQELNSHEEKSKSCSSSLSAEARPFLPLKTYILVSSQKSDLSFSLPVSSDTLSISTLRQYFPLATSMYFIDNGQMITLATSKKCNTVMNTGTEFSELNFCIPDSCHQYFVLEQDEFGRHGLCETSMEEAVKCVEGIKYKLSSTMAEMKKLEEEVKELLNLLRDQAGDTFWKLNNMANDPNNQYYVYDINQNYSESADAYRDGDHVEIVHTSNEYAAGMGCSLSHKESRLKFVSSEAEEDLAMKEEVVTSHDLVVDEKKYVDDYGFSDTDIDDDIYDVTAKNVDCKKVIQGNSRYVEVDKISSSSAPVDAVIVPRYKSESCSLSSRPRCVRRVVGK